jgi:thiamine pyrophosphate-dependent acetolactate synthase large subunit-like protein
VIDSIAAEVDQNFVPDVELIGDIAHVLARLAAGCSRSQTTAGTSRLHEVVMGALIEARDGEHYPMRPPRVLWEIREALGRNDILVSDVGLHKLWIGRMFPGPRAWHGADRQTASRGWDSRSRPRSGPSSSTLIERWSRSAAMAAF